MWDILLGAVIGAVAGYAAYKTVDALWPRFVDLWEDFVAVATEIFEYLTEATENFLAHIAEFLQDQWSEIKSFAVEEFGYIKECIVFLFKQDGEVYLGFMNSDTEETSIGSIGQAPSDVQLPTQQVIAATLDLRN